ncbi:MAG: ribonuclease Z [Bacteroidales bacterium]|jgi:ribonuclease Z|nr:ribonuclease Z [Bacteroidales bacterium]
MTAFSVTVLGSNAALPTLQRFSSAQWLQSGEQAYLIDCAEGTQIQLRRFHLKSAALKAIFISHLHGDHVFGLPGLLSSLSLLDRAEPLDIFGPLQMEEWLTGHLKHFLPLSFPVRIHHTTADEPMIIHEDKCLTVTCFPLKHRIPTWGYLFRERKNPLHIRKDVIPLYQIPFRDIPAIKAGADYRTSEGQIIPNSSLTLPPVAPRSYAYCSDTAYLPQLSQILREVDLLYHEATFADEDRKRATKTFHSTAKEAAEIAKEACVGRLIIGHFSSRYEDPLTLLQEAQSVFPHTEVAEDGKTYGVRNPFNAP